MRFSKLKLNGFKSFVDSTDLMISDGLTGVVGPNGCGKSNLLEALRWVMGENRPKAIRGAGMDDVIFAGAASRPAKNFAEVSLTVDNSDRSAPKVFDNVTDFEVLRRITRDSGSTYKVNGKDARARDVQMLFADASTGAHSPALVRQGQIAELINAKPKSRRRILEEAAGISGLYQRRHEAELKLSGAETNLSRVDDTIDQLASQLSQLAKQAKQAIKYREIGEVIRKLEGQILYIKWKESEDKQIVAETEKEQAHKKAADAELEANKCFDKREKSENLMPKLREDSANAVSYLQKLKVEKETLINAQKLILDEIQKLETDIEQLKIDIQREQVLNNDASQTLSSLESEKSDLLLSTADYSQRLTKAIEVSRSSAKELQKLEGELSNKTEDNARLLAKHQSAQGLYEELKATQERINSDKEKSLLELDGLRKNVEAETTKSSKAQEDFKNAKNQFENADTQLNQVEKTRSELQSREAEARSISSEAGGIEKVLQAEADAISRLLKRETSEVRQLIDQIQVKPGYELALGAAFQDDLKNPELGEGQRTGWIKMNVEDGDHSLPDGVEPLSSIVKGSVLISRRLAQVGIVDAAHGKRLQNDLKPGQRLVSMDGGLWRWDGFTVDASDLSNSSALRLKQLNRLEELKKELSEAKATSEGAEQAHKSLQDQLLKLTEIGQKARGERQEADRLMTESNRLMSNAESEKNISEGKVENLLLTIERYKNELLSTEKRLFDANNIIGGLDDLEKAQTETQKLKKTVENSRTNMIAKRSVSDTIRNENELTLRRLDEIEEQFLVWTSRFDLADQRINELRSRLEWFEENLKIAKNRPNEILNNINNLDKKLQASEKLSLESTEKLAVAEALLRREVDNERNAERNASEAREERARNDVILETAVNNVEFCLRRIVDEYGLSPEELRLDLELSEEDKLEASTLEEKVDRHKRQRDGLGAVNLRAEEDTKEVQDQYDEIKKEKEDLAEAIKKLRSGIASLNREGRERILTAFEQVNENFNNLFKNLFSGGDGKLVMVESDDPLDAGLEIMCQPPGKKLSTLSLLSGGEQTLTALALIFAVFLANPAPLCVLDEVDAPLDDSNITRFCDLLDEMIRQTDTRFLIITHHAITMSRMDRLFGVTMGELGVSQLVSVDLKMAETLVA